jgi:hypothetical protein
MATTISIVKPGITRLSAAALVERARAIIAALTGNASFTSPQPPLADVGAAASALEAADAAVLNNGGRQDYLARTMRMQELRDLLFLLAAYVQVASAGDREKILSAGYEYRKTAAPAGVLPAPGDLRAETSTLTGRIDLRWNGVANRFVYELQRTEGDPQLPTGWIAVVSQGSNAFADTGLTSDKHYSYRVRAIGAAGPGPWSDTATQKPR